ncbi:MAG: 3,4-dihydroxy-2-butanone-4-phosphate synthase [Proteobacteria bacterium]|nr:3,4-dihydroxy-2-butanone-4-phosphate synthase [Pseudomonadota bacterium]
MEHQDKGVARVLAAIEAIRAGGMVIMVDDEDRENEGDLVFAAEHATADKINFMAKEARGLICLPLAPKLVSDLKLPLMDDVTKGPGDHTTAFTVSIEARYGVTTGISAADRAHTVRVAAADGAKPEDLVVPGHIFPLRARPGGVLERSGHTEGSVDLARLSGCKPAAVICEIMNDDGTMARMSDLEVFAKKHGLIIVTIDDLIAYRLTRDSLVKIVSQGQLETTHGTFESILFESVLDQSQHLALLKNSARFSTDIVDVRVHRQRPILDVFVPSRSSGRYLVDYGLEMLNRADAGAFIYLSQMGNDQTFSDFSEVVKSVHGVKEEPTKHHAMDSRQLGIGAQIIRVLGIQRMRTHVSAQRTLKGIAGFGLEVVDHVIIDSQN